MRNTNAAPRQHRRQLPVFMQVVVARISCLAVAFAGCPSACAALRVATMDQRGAGLSPARRDFESEDPQELLSGCKARKIESTKDYSRCVDDIADQEAKHEQAMLHTAAEYKEAQMETRKLRTEIRQKERELDALDKENSKLQDDFLKQVKKITKIRNETTCSLCRVDPGSEAEDAALDEWLKCEDEVSEMQLQVDECKAELNADRSQQEMRLADRRELTESRQSSVRILREQSSLLDSQIAAAKRRRERLKTSIEKLKAEQPLAMHNAVPRHSFLRHVALVQSSSRAASAALATLRRADPRDELDDDDARVSRGDVVEQQVVSGGSDGTRDIQSWREAPFDTESVADKAEDVAVAAGENETVGLYPDDPRTREASRELRDAKAAHRDAIAAHEQALQRHQDLEQVVQKREIVAARAKMQMEKASKTVDERNETLQREEAEAAEARKEAAEAEQRAIVLRKELANLTNASREAFRRAFLLESERNEAKRRYKDGLLKARLAARRWEQQQREANSAKYHLSKVNTQKKRLEWRYNKAERQRLEAKDAAEVARQDVEKAKHQVLVNRERVRDASNGLEAAKHGGPNTEESAAHTRSSGIRASPLRSIVATALIVFLLPSIASSWT